jgi:hypothetical protein
VPYYDVVRRKGVPRVDAECTGITMRDYLRASDLSHIPADLVSFYDGENADAGVLIYQRHAEHGT